MGPFVCSVFMETPIFGVYNQVCFISGAGSTFGRGESCRMLLRNSVFSHFVAG